MIPELIPVVLKFNNVAANSNINFTFTTVGASWCLGANSGDSLGFAFNVMTDSSNAQSCIQSIEFNNSVLAIRTAATGQSLNSFILTLFLRVKEGVDYLQGYCTLNNEAIVLASFGTQRAVQWRNGRISAVLREPESKFRRIFFAIKGAKPGNRISLQVSTKKGLGKVNWSLGPEFSEASGIQVASAAGVVPLASMSYGCDRLVFETTQSDWTGDTMDFFLQTYVVWEPLDLNYIYLKADCNSSISLYAQVGNRQPQIVSQTDTLFTL